MYLRYIENREAELLCGCALPGIDAVDERLSRHLQQLKAKLVTSLDMDESLRTYLSELLHLTGPCSLAHFIANSYGDFEVAAWANNFVEKDIENLFFDSLEDMLDSLLVDDCGSGTTQMRIPDDVCGEALFGSWLCDKAVTGILCVTRSNDSVVGATLAFREARSPFSRLQSDFLGMGQHLFAGQLERLRALYSRGKAFVDWPPDWSSEREDE